jgi:PAS domain S-box-containing protein
MVHRTLPPPSAEQLQGLLDRSKQATVIVRESGSILYASPAACELLGYTLEELRGQSVELLMPQRYRLAHIGHRLRFVDEQRTRLMGGGSPLRIECKDGSERAVQISLRPIRRGLEVLFVAVIQSRG